MKCLEILNLKPNNLKLYEQALTHSSYAHENNLDNNERLEFLGDAVLELIASEYLYKNSVKSEGEMTKLRSILVCTDALYNYAKNLEIEADLRLGAGEEKNMANRKSVLADATEALIAVIYLDQGFNTVKRVVEDLLLTTDLANNDYKSTLQEFMQTTKRPISYELVDETGPAHDKTFTVVVKVDNIIYGKGSASSKKEAEQLAAKAALNKKAE